eukprot:758640-Hanusia_phi.AAC.4
MEGLERLEGLTELGGPSLFEVVGAERLAAAAAAALDHVLRVWGIRASSSFWWVRSCREEVIGIMRLLMERQSMEGRDASAGEGFFGLIREQVGGQAPSARQKRLSLIFLVALPYLQAKIDSITRRSEDDELEEASMPAGNFEPPVEGRLWAQAIGLPAAAGNAWRPPSSPAWTWLDWARAVWPWTQALKEGCVSPPVALFVTIVDKVEGAGIPDGISLRQDSFQRLHHLVLRSVHQMDVQMLKSARAAQFAWANKHAMSECFFYLRVVLIVTQADPSVAESAFQGGRHANILMNRLPHVDQDTESDDACRKGLFHGPSDLLALQHAVTKEPTSWRDRWISAIRQRLRDFTLFRPHPPSALLLGRTADHSPAGTLSRPDKLRHVRLISGDYATSPSGNFWLIVKPRGTMRS